MEMSETQDTSFVSLPPSHADETAGRDAKVRTMFIFSLAGLLVVTLVTFGPLAILRLDRWATDSTGSGQDQLKHVADTRTALLQLIGGAAAAVTVYFTWRNFVRSMAESARAQEEALAARRQATDTRIADSYIKAAELLGRESQAVRASGALAFGRILRSVSESSDLSDYWAVMDALTTFVRHRTDLRKDVAEPPKPDQDIEAAINVLARRTYASVPHRDDDSPTDLSGCNLTGAWMTGGKFPRSYFGGSKFCNANFDNADVSSSDFQRSDLTGAYFRSANVKDADFTRSNIEDAYLDGTNLLAAKLNEKQRAWWTGRMESQQVGLGTGDTST